MTGPVIVLIILGAVVTLLLTSITVVPQSEVYIIERLRIYKETLDTGIHVKVPFLDHVAKKITLKEQMADFPPWPVITKDNVSIQVDTVVFYQVIEPMLYAYGVELPLAGVENLTSSILRNIIGAIDFNDILASRDVINSKMRRELDEATDPWGIKVNRVELREIQTPLDLQEDMVKKLRADIEKAEAIKRAEGKAAAIKMINEAAPGSEYLQLQALEAFGKAADGKATKIVIPSDIQGIAGLAKGFSEIVGKDPEA